MYSCLISAGRPCCLHRLYYISYKIGSCGSKPNCNLKYLTDVVTAVSQHVTVYDLRSPSRNLYERSFCHCIPKILSKDFRFSCRKKIGSPNLMWAPEIDVYQMNSQTNVVFWREFKWGITKKAQAAQHCERSLDRDNAELPFLFSWVTRMRTWMYIRKSQQWRAIGRAGDVIKSGKTKNGTL